MSTYRAMIRTSVSRPLGLRLPSSINSKSLATKVPRSSYDTEKRVGWSGDKRSRPVAVAAAATTESLETSTGTGGVELPSLLANVTNVVILILKVATKPKPWKLHMQFIIEKVIIDCRFFTLLAVAGSLLGSVLCFLEGCFTILESYLQYFHTLSERSDQGHVVQLLIEAIDMFLVGTALLIFGMGLYAMFVGSRHLKGQVSQLPKSNFFGLFNLRTLPRWAGMKSVDQAKSRIGHAMMMILQVGMVEKFRTVPMATGPDLACFAASVFISSASLFLLSKLSANVTSIRPNVAEK